VSAAGPLLDAGRITALPGLLAELGADAWLLYDFQDRSPVAHTLLGLGHTTRRGFALFPAEGPPVALCHPVDLPAWAPWPWELRRYTQRYEFEAGLRALLGGARIVAMEVSPGSAIPTLDLVPAGIVGVLEGLGVRVISSGDLVTAFHARWSEHGLDLHRAAARVVRSVAHEALRLAARSARGPAPFAEAELRDWIRARLREEGLTEQEDAIVAVGPSSADPHYEPEGVGAPILADALVLVDLWGAFSGGVPADQTWMGYLGAAPPDDVREVWGAVRDARDGALAFLEERAHARRDVRGYEVDAVARASLRSTGFDDAFVHRLGHSIDTQLHGSGPNLDDFETRDERRLLPGVGFSVEPGVYLPGRFGVRSEVNVFWGESGPEVTPSEIQRDLLLLDGSEP